MGSGFYWVEDGDDNKSTTLMPKSKESAYVGLQVAG